MKRYYYLLKGLGVWSRKARVGGSSEALYRSIEEQATQNVWWTALGIPKTWITEHALLSLHMWLLHNRFKVDYNVPGDFNGRRMQEQLFERFWEDTVLRIRNAGVSDRLIHECTCVCACVCLGLRTLYQHEVAAPGSRDTAFMFQHLVSALRYKPTTGP